ncbi:MAG: hypothetical protein DHS20C10_02680 [marine bacterium B5-7]|nr:MAG: hypothetical protein DHS20C10_02680 [marine bacterium B5-7]
MRTFFRALIATIFLSCTLTHATTKVLDRVVAVVNNSIVTQHQLNAAVQQVKSNLKRAKVKTPSDKALREQVLQQLIMQDIQLELAKRNQISISDQDVDNAIAAMAKQNHISMKQLQNKITKSGGNFHDFRHELHKQLLTQKLQGLEVGAKIHISDQEVAQTRRMLKHQKMQVLYHLQNILIPLPPIPSTAAVQAAKQEANTILLKLKNGADFKQIAVSHSSADNALEGGDLGWRHLAEMPDAFAAAARTAQMGDVLGPIRTANGFHLLKVLAIKNKTKTKALSDNDIRNMLYRRKMLEQVQLWLQALRGNAYVKMIPSTK